jgi:hypothetical protein
MGCADIEKGQVLAEKINETTGCLQILLPATLPDLRTLSATSDLTHESPI